MAPHCVHRRMLVPALDVSWGGYTITLTAIFGVCTMVQWSDEWDFFVNLSASDFPLLPQVRFCSATVPRIPLGCMCGITAGCGCSYALVLRTVESLYGSPVVTCSVVDVLQITGLNISSTRAVRRVAISFCVSSGRAKGDAWAIRRPRHELCVGGPAQREKQGRGSHR